MKGILGRCAATRFAVVTVLLAGSGLRGSGQKLESSVQVRDVPFQATQVVTRTIGSGTTVTRGRMARDAAGSTYVELVDPATGTATTAFLLDVPGRRGIVLDLVHKRYSIRPAPQLAAREISAATVPEELDRAVEMRGRSERQLQGGVEGMVTQLGVKMISGLITVGRRRIWPGESGREMESWFSVDLGMCVRMTEVAVGQTTEVGLTEILRTEPDAALFRVPADFMPDGGTGAPPTAVGPATSGE